MGKLHYWKIINMETLLYIRSHHTILSLIIFLLLHIILCFILYITHDNSDYLGTVY